MKVRSPYRPNFWINPFHGIVFVMAFCYSTGNINNDLGCVDVLVEDENTGCLRQ